MLLFVAEQFAFQQGIGNGRAVDRYQRLIVTQAQAVDGPCRQFLAVPVSPLMRTVVGVGPTWRISSKTSWILLSFPTIGFVAELPVQFAPDQFILLHQPSAVILNCCKLWGGTFPGPPIPEKTATACSRQVV